jgi:hypothetical protein
MAIDNQFGKGIGVAAGFDLGAQKPLDARIAVNTIAERDAHVENNRAYEGMVVFVDETKLNYQLINGEWVELLKSEKDRLDVLEAQLNGGEGTEGSGVLAELKNAIDEVNDRLEEGGDIAEKIAQNEADIDALDEKIGAKAEFDAEGKEIAPATGVHKYIDEQDAQLREELADAIAKEVEDRDAAILVEKERAEEQETAIRQEMADEADRVDQKIADDIAAESALRVAEEGKIREEFAAADAALKAELQKEIDDDVKVEKERAVAEEAKIREEFAAADNLLGQKIDREIQNREAAIKTLVDGDIADLKGFKDGHSHAQMEADIAQLKQDVDAVEVEIGKKAADGAGATGMYKYIDDKFTAQNTDMQDFVNHLNGLVSAEETARKAADQEIKGLINTLQADVDQNELDCDAAVEAEKVRAEAAEKVLREDLAQEVQDRKDAVSAEADLRVKADNALDERLQAVEEMVGLESGADGESLSDRVKANEDKLAGLEEGCNTVQAAIDKAEADAKAHAEQKIADLIDSAPEAMDTLNELAKAIKDNKDVYDGYVAEHTQAMTQMKKDLQDEIDADVLVEKERAEGQEAAIRKELSDAIEQEVEDRNAAIKVEADRALAAEQAIQKQISEGLKTAAYDGDKEYPNLAPLA